MLLANQLFAKHPHRGSNNGQVVGLVNGCHKCIRAWTYLRLSPILVFAAVNAPLMGQTCLYSILNLIFRPQIWSRVNWQTCVQYRNDLVSKDLLKIKPQKTILKPKQVGLMWPQTHTVLLCCDTFVACCGLTWPENHTFVACCGLKHTFVACCGLWPQKHTFVACCGLVVASRRIFPRKNALWPWGLGTL